MVIGLKKKYPKNYKLTIRNIESFYNYRTIGKNFHYYTSVLSMGVSDETMKFIKIDIKGFLKY
jgi:glycosylphosphatidylinositol transamidase (GPIT) subunit GPI8